MYWCIFLNPNTIFLSKSSSLYNMISITRWLIINYRIVDVITHLLKSSLNILFRFPILTSPLFHFLFIRFAKFPFSWNLIPNSTNSLTSTLSLFHRELALFSFSPPIWSWLASFFLHLSLNFVYLWKVPTFLSWVSILLWNFQNSPIILCSSKCLFQLWNMYCT